MKLPGDVLPYPYARRGKLGMQLGPSVDEGDDVFEIVVVKVACSAVT